MKKLQILLVCGSGASSGFMANSLRKAAKEMGYDVQVFARSESEIEDYIDTVDAIMIGPHFAHIVEETEDLGREYNVTVVLMKSSYYKTLDGNEALEHLLSELNKKKEKNDE